MSVRHEEDLPEIEAYRDLAPGTVILARRNDMEIPAGSRGTVARRIPETGNYQCLFDLAEGRKRVVALTADQVRPVEVAPPPPVTPAPSAWTPEKRAAQAERMRAMHAARKAREQGGTAPPVGEPTPIRVTVTTAPEPEPVVEVQPAAAPDPPGQGFAAVFFREAARERDWKGEIVSSVRTVLANAAGEATARDLALMVEVIAYIEQQEGAGE